MMRLLTTIFLLLSFPACGETISANATALGFVPVTVTATDTSPGATIPSDFIGFSFETCGNFLVCPSPGWKIAESYGINYFTASNTKLINAIKNISSTGIIRIGGNSSDFYPVVTPTSIDCLNLAAFLSKTGWKTIYGLDAKANDPATAANTASCISGALGPSLYSYQIGNEPSLTTTFPSGQTNFTSDLSTYFPLWLAYQSKIGGSYTYCGPDDVSIPNMGSFVSAIEKIHLNCLSYHLYTLGDGKELTSNITNLLASSYTTVIGHRPPYSYSPTAIGYCASNKLACRITEMNTAFGGGTNGVSNALASAEWIVDYGMALAKAGWSSIHVHGTLQYSPSAKPLYYAPIIETTDFSSITARPIYYGMLMLGQLEGGRFLPVSTTGNGKLAPPNISSWGVIGADGKTRIFVGNRTQNQSIVVTLARVSSWTSASILTIRGRSCSATQDITYASSVLAADGTISPAPLTISKGKTITLSPCESLLATLL